MKRYLLGVMLFLPCFAFAAGDAEKCRNHFLHGQYFIAEDSCLAAAEAGDLDAPKWLAFMYTKGKGVQQDYKKAFFWRNKAAQAGDANSQYHLGRFYQMGDGAEQDYNKARHWYGKSAAQGDVNGLYALGNMYGKGVGGSVDREKAYACFMLAAENNFLLAVQALESMEKMMTINERAEGKRLADAGLWKQE